MELDSINGFSNNWFMNESNSIKTCFLMILTNKLLFLFPLLCSLFFSDFCWLTDMQWVLLEITWRWCMWIEHLSQTKPFMLFQVHWRLFIPGIICEHYRWETAIIVELFTCICNYVPSKWFHQCDITVLLGMSWSLWRTRT